MGGKWKTCIGSLMMALTLQLVTGQASLSTTLPTATSTFSSMVVNVISENIIGPDMTESPSITETTQSPTPTPTQTPIPISTSTSTVMPSSDVMPTTSISVLITSSAMPPTSSPMPPVTSPTPTPTTTTEIMQSTNPPPTTTDSPPRSVPSTASPASSGFPDAAIYGIAAGGGALLIIVAVAILICCCCCCCSCNKSEDYVPDKPFMVVRTYDHNFAPMDRSGSLISNRSRGNSMRSSISSIASSIRSSIRRLSRKNRAVSGGDGQIAMKVTPL